MANCRRLNRETRSCATCFPACVIFPATAPLKMNWCGSGVAPFLLAAGWSLAAVLKPPRAEAHAFAVLFLVLVPLVTLEAASFDVRFTPGRPT